MIIGFLIIIMLLSLVTIIWMTTLYKGEEKSYMNYNFFSAVAIVMLSLVIAVISMQQQGQARTIIKYCNGEIKIDTVAVSPDGKLYEIKIIK